MTTAVGTCASCGAAGPVGAVHVYRGAGIVLRCPHCDSVLAKIVKSDPRVWIDLTGIPHSGSHRLAWYADELPSMNWQISANLGRRTRVGVKASGWLWQITRGIGLRP
jgi:hypothetical protein